MQKIGILGGTFNPIHTGHLMLAEYARDALFLDEVWLMTTGASYMKDERTIASAEDRMNMVNLAIEDNVFLKSSDIEIIRQGDTYTYETMKILSGQYPDAEFYFITGADCLFSIERWKCPEQIFEACTLVCAVRNGVSVEDMEAQKRRLEALFNARVALLPMPNIDISSTDIRNRIREKHSVRYFVPDKVFRYIQDRELYGYEKG